MTGCSQDSCPAPAPQEDLAEAFARRKLEAWLERMGPDTHPPDLEDQRQEG